MEPIARIITSVKAEIISDTVNSVCIYNCEFDAEEFNTAIEACTIREVYPPELLCIFCFECKINYIKKTDQGVRIPARLMPRQYVWVEIVEHYGYKVKIMLLKNVNVLDALTSAAKTFYRVKNACPFCVGKCNSMICGEFCIGECNRHVNNCHRYGNHYRYSNCDCMCNGCSNRLIRWDDWNPFGHSIEEASNEDLTFEITIEEFSAMIECAKIHAPNY